MRALATVAFIIAAITAQDTEDSDPTAIPTDEETQPIEDLGPEWTYKENGADWADIGYPFCALGRE